MGLMIYLYPTLNTVINNFKYSVYTTIIIGKFIFINVHNIYKNYFTICQLFAFLYNSLVTNIICGCWLDFERNKLKLFTIEKCKATLIKTRF